MSENLQIARKALALADKGKSNIEIKAALKLNYAQEAANFVLVGNIDRKQNEAKLTDLELALIKSVALAERRALERRETCSPKLKYCSPALGFWPKSRAAYLAYKRLGTHRAGEDERRPGSGLGLLHPYAGYVRLTRAGWALVHALEAMQ